VGYLARVADRTVRLEPSRAADGALLVRVGEGDSAETRRLEIDRRGPFLVVRLEDGRCFEAVVERREAVTVVWLAGRQYAFALADERAARRAHDRAGGGGGPQTVKAPMPGKVVKHLVTVGDRVEAGQGVVVIEAMKMENELRAPAPGVVKALPAAEGTAVEAGAPLVVLE
jgi:biotin carboxyl carrier protein